MRKQNILETVYLDWKKIKLKNYINYINFFYWKNVMKQIVLKQY